MGLKQDKVREVLQAQIAALVKTRDASTDPDEQAAASDAIKVLRLEIKQLDIGVADKLGERVDAIIARLDQILEENSLDAVSALGRTFNRLRDLRDGRKAGG